MMDEIKSFQEYLFKMKRDVKTIKAYCTDIDLFFKHIKKSLHNIDEFDIEMYKTLLINKGYKITSINRKLVALNLFMKFHKHNIQVSQEKVQMQVFLDNVIEVEELDKIVEKARLHKDYRAIALLSSMYFTGMRISECLSLKVSDLSKDTVLILGKGKKYRNVFIPKKLQLIWQEYIPYRINKGDMLFTTREGTMTTRTANNIFKKYGKMASVDESKNHNHNLRHLYAKRLASKKVNIEVIADLLGHSSLETSRLYLKSSKKELMNIINDL